MARAPREKAINVCVGDLILNAYAPRTWRPVTAVEHYQNSGTSVMIDTATDRTWWEPEELVPCKRASNTGD